MATLSIGKAWEESTAFVRRESALLFPVALLFVALPGLIFQEMVPPELTQWMASQPKTTPPPVGAAFWVAFAVMVVVVWFGSLTLFALALRPGISVGEALRLSVARLPVLLGTALALLGLFLAAALILGVFVALLGFLSKGAAALVGSLAVAIAGGVMIFAAVRLLLLNPVVIDGVEGVFAAIRHAWSLTRGHFWRLLAFLLLLTLLSLVASTAAQAVVGTLIGFFTGPEGARLGGGIAGALVSTAIQVYMLVMIARLYRQAEGG
ncbi:MAG: hypothetical protein QHC40_11125 [Sphingobium sp.]|nr:hypothetical protein [Sphingobium sp.]